MDPKSFSSLEDITEEYKQFGQTAQTEAEKEQQKAMKDEAIKLHLWYLSNLEAFKERNNYSDESVKAAVKDNLFLEDADERSQLWSKILTLFAKYAPHLDSHKNFTIYFSEFVLDRLKKVLEVTDVRPASTLLQDELKQYQLSTTKEQLEKFLEENTEFKVAEFIYGVSTAINNSIILTNLVHAFKSTHNQKALEIYLEQIQKEDLAPLRVNEDLSIEELEAQAKLFNTLYFELAVSMSQVDVNPYLKHLEIEKEKKEQGLN